MKQTQDHQLMMPKWTMKHIFREKKTSFSAAVFLNNIVLIE